MTGLKSKPELNGAAGTVAAYDESTGRYQVQLSSGESIALQPKNLKVEREEEEEEDVVVNSGAAAAAHQDNNSPHLHADPVAAVAAAASAAAEAAIVDVDSMAEDDVIELLLDVDHNYFAMLGLPQPSPDLLGRPFWPVSNGSLMRQYRRVARRVHPDKSSHRDAQQAFDALQVRRTHWYYLSS